MCGGVHIMVDNVHNLSYNSRYVAVPRACAVGFISWCTTCTIYHIIAAMWQYHVHVRWGSYHGGQRAQSII